MSIIRESRVVTLLQSLWFVPWILLLSWAVSLWATHTAYPQFGLVVNPLLVGFFSSTLGAMLVWWRRLQKSVIRFNNIREALVSGYVVIATNQDDTLRQIAHDVSCYLAKLGINHFGSDGFTKHLVAEGDQSNDMYYRVPIDYIKSKVPDKSSKLTLVIAAKSDGNDGVMSVEYCLLDNSGKSVISLDENWVDDGSWPVVSCYNQGQIPSRKRATSQIAREMVGSLFHRLNLTIWAATARTGGAKRTA